ncbi:MAG TPA: CFI-box-CTERM domain-containing protein, partial [Nannocystis sp.]
WGVYSHGPGSGGGGTGGDTDTGGGGGTGTGGGGGTGEDDSETGGEGTGGGGEPMGGGGGGWGGCTIRPLPPIDDLTLTALSFDRVRVDFRLPEQASEFDLRAVHVYHITGESKMLDEELLGAAHLSTFQASELPAGSGLVGVEIGELWGDYTYQFGVVYEDACTNRSELVTAMITTPAQKFQTVDSFCFVATAAYGAPWAAQVAALRAFRDAYLKTSPTGLDLVRFYYAHSPPLARVIEREPLLRGLARVVLQPVADAAEVLQRAPGAAAGG